MKAWWRINDKTYKVFISLLPVSSALLYETIRRSFDTFCFNKKRFTDWAASSMDRFRVDTECYSDTAEVIRLEFCNIGFLNCKRKWALSVAFISFWLEAFPSDHKYLFLLLELQVSHWK